MRIGPLRHRMTFQQPNTAQDSFGQPLTTWVDVVTLWVEIRPLSAREVQAAQAVGAEVSHEINLRWHPLLADLKAVSAMRGVFNSRYFNLTSPLNQEERNRWLSITATEGLNNG